MRMDPACGMLVDETRPAEEAVYRDRRYYFCSAECRAAFVRNPDGYLKDRLRAHDATAEEPPAKRRTK